MKKEENFMQKYAKAFGAVTLFIVSLSLIIKGTQESTWSYVFLQVLGLAGLLTLLYLYNRIYTDRKKR